MPVGAAIAALISQGLAGLSVNAPSSRYKKVEGKKKKKKGWLLGDSYDGPDWRSASDPDFIVFFQLLYFLHAC